MELYLDWPVVMHSSWTGVPIPVLLLDWRAVAHFWYGCFRVRVGAGKAELKACARCVKMMPHAIADLIEEFRMRGESRADICLGTGGTAPDRNMLDGMLRYMPFVIFMELPFNSPRIYTTRPPPFHILQRLVQELIAICQRTGTLEDFKNGCAEEVLVLVDWDEKKLREDFVPGETFADFSRRVREPKQVETRGDS